MFNEILDSFSDPGPAFRGKPFWAWNGRLESDEIKRQIAILKQMGMGGAFLHSRVGLKTPYMGDEWFQITHDAIEEMTRLGLEPWLYDEDRWPSGYAGGLATRQPEHRIKFVIMELIPTGEFKPSGEEVGLWTGVVNGRSASRLTRPTLVKPVTAENPVALVFRIDTMPECEWFNGSTYLDVMSEDAVEGFIELTHEAYRKRLDPAVFSRVEGIFTDEPNFSTFLPDQVPQPRNEHRYAFLPWTPDLPDRFLERYGYDLLDALPGLFLDVEGMDCAQQRVDYWNLCTHLFSTRFMKKIHDWCEQHQWRLTGHVLFEQPLQNQVMTVGAAMRHYEYMQLPGMDLLTEFFDEYDTAKQVQSAKHQFGRSFMMSEMYGCTGWDFGMEGHKALGDWQAALGVNLRCHHLSWYTMAGEAKRDYPASIFFQSPWHDRYDYVESYFSRVNVALTAGRPVQRIGVLHPVETMFARFRPLMLNTGEPPNGLMGLQSADILEVNETMVRLRNWLLEEHLDFDYLDEDIMARHGRVAHEGGGAVLHVGEAQYRAVVVPPVDVLRPSSVDLFCEFAAQGGEVLLLGDMPRVGSRTGHASAEELARVATRLDFERNATVGHLDAHHRLVSLHDTAGAQVPCLMYQLRQLDGGWVLFACNRDRQGAREEVTVAIKAEGAVYELDAETGNRYRIPAQTESGWTRFETRFAPSGSRLFLLTREALEAPEHPAGALEATHALCLGAPEMTMPLEANTLVLDRAQWKHGNLAQWRGPEEILRIDRQLRTELGWPLRGGAMVQPWATETERQADILTLRYGIEAAEDIAMPVGLVMEQPERWTMQLNGKVLPFHDEGFWIDTAFRKMVLPAGALRKGSNELVLSTRMLDTTDLESIYLVGDFGVSLAGATPTVHASQPSLGHGSWTGQGFPFYGGAMRYVYRVNPGASAAAASFDRAMLQFEELSATMLVVRANGGPEHVVPWPPYELDLTEACRTSGPIEIEVVVYGSRRNTFGPLHQKQTKPHWVGPMNFVTDETDWTETPHLRPCGLITEPVLRFYRAQT